MFAFTAYLLWGLFPLYFVALAPASPLEIVSWRILLSLVFCALLITVTRAWRLFGSLIRNWRVTGAFAIAGALIYVNWLVYVIATQTNHIVEASLGYFINPIVTVLIGVFLLRERLRPLQWAAIALASVAVVVLTVGYGQLPVIALVLAISFAFYGYVKNRAGRVDAVSGLTLETLWLAPVALGQLVFIGATSGVALGANGVWHAVLLSMAGVVTAIPLLFFAGAARRIPLVYVGLIQFSSPIVQFAMGVFIFGEPMPIERWIGFGIVWLACLVMVIDSLRHSRRARTSAPVGDENDPLAEVALNASESATNR